MEPVPETGYFGGKTLRVELILRLRNVQDIWVGAASQFSTSDKLLEGGPICAAHLNTYHESTDRAKRGWRHHAYKKVVVR